MLSLLRTKKYKLKQVLNKKMTSWGKFQWQIKIKMGLTFKQKKGIQTDLKFYTDYKM